MKVKENSIKFVTTEDRVKTNIYEFCLDNGLNYSKLCNQAGLNKNIIYPFMKGERSITLSTLEKIERFIYEYQPGN